MVIVSATRDTKSDLLDKVAHISNSKYTQKKSTASLWKSELKKILIDKFDNNFLKLQIALQDAGIQRRKPL